MKSLTEELKEHLDLKLHIRKFNTMDAVYQEVSSVFEMLEYEMNSYVVDGNPLVIADISTNTGFNSYSAKLLVDISLSDGRSQRKIIVEPEMASGFGVYKFSVNCQLPGIHPDKLYISIAKIEISKEESVLKPLDEGLELKIGCSEKIAFTRKNFENLIKEILFYKV